MEWFWKIVEHLQKSAANSILQSFAPTDWLIVIAILWGFMLGGRKGFSEMLGKLLGIILVSMLTLSFYPGVAAFVSSNIPGTTRPVVEPFVFFLFAVFFWFSVAWVLNMSGKFLRVEAQGNLKVLGGGVFGILRMLLLLSFVAQFLLFLPIEPLRQVFKPGRTYLGYTVSRFVPDLYKLVNAPFHKPTLKESVDPSKAGA